MESRNTSEDTLVTDPSDLARKSRPTALVANLQLNGISGFGSESVHFDSPNLSRPVLSRFRAIARWSQEITNLTRMP